MCLRSLSSRYVRFERTEVEKGFMIFLIATDEPVSWSFAELSILLSLSKSTTNQGIWN